MESGRIVLIPFVLAGCQASTARLSVVPTVRKPEVFAKSVVKPPPAVGRTERIPRDLEGVAARVVRSAAASYGLKLPPPPRDGQDKRALIAYLAQIQTRFEESSVVAPPPVQIPAIADPVLAKLARTGYVAPYGPLVRGKGARLTAAEYGDALSLALVRGAAGLTVPSPEYTPAIQD